MKSLVKIALLSGVMALSLTACSTERKCYCLETSDSTTFVDGKCFQVDGTRDIVETIFITNPNGADVEFNTIINESHITFTDGLKGKVFDSITIVGDGHTLKFEMHGLLRDQEATHGYIRISPQAFKAHTDNSKEAYLYAYFAIGDRTADVDKPDNITF